MEFEREPLEAWREAARRAKGAPDEIKKKKKEKTKLSFESSSHWHRLFLLVHNDPYIHNNFAIIENGDHVNEFINMILTISLIRLQSSLLHW